VQTITAQQRDCYLREGYLHLRGVVPPDLLSLTEYVLSRWVDDTIEQWLGEGRIADTRKDLDFQHRLVQVWRAAGKPKYVRSPRRDLVCPAMYRILVHPALLDIAEALLGTPEVSVHGIFNARPKLPDQIWTRTPWHQDAQYYRDAADGHVVSLWYPLQPVTEHNSCLQVAPRMHRGPVLDGHHDEETGFLGLSPADRQGLTGVSVEMKPGDLLCFTQKTPHRALPNQSDAARWSLDVRYEATDRATESGKDKGFVARSPRNPSAVVPCAEWEQRWTDVEKGSY
jgi:ectoine hydroxylase-related dioxygenase (phytanoyl-CoA dioxygenase family)